MSERRYPGSGRIGHPLRMWLKPACELSLVGLALFLLFIGYGILPNRWYHTLYVYSGSMSPAIESGDVIIISPPPAQLLPGMVITLKVDEYLVTHRLIDLQPDGKFTTRGDANLWADEWGSANVKVVGLYRARIPYLGYGLAALKNLMKVDVSGSWFVDREMLNLQAIFDGPKATDIPAITETPTPDPPAGQSGTSISAEITVENVCEQKGDEDDDNEDQDNENHDNEDGSTSRNPEMERCEEKDSKHNDSKDNDSEERDIEKKDHLEVKGQVCMNNNGDTATRDLKAFLQLQSKSEKNKFQNMSDVFIELIPSEPLEPGASQCYDYQMDFKAIEDVENYRVTASVTITNHSGYLPGGNHCPGPALCPVGPTPKASFTVLCRKDESNDKDKNDPEVIPGLSTLSAVLETPLPTETLPPALPTEETPLPTETPEPAPPVEETPLSVEVMETNPPPQETEPPAVTGEAAPPPEVTEDPAPTAEATEESPPPPPPVE